MKEYTSPPLVEMYIDTQWKTMQSFLEMLKNRTSVCAKSPQSCPTLCNPVDCSPPGPLPVGLSRQEYWSGLPCSPPGDCPNPGIKATPLMSPGLAGRFFTTSANWETPELKMLQFTSGYAAKESKLSISKRDLHSRFHCAFFTVAKIWK